MNQAAYGKKSVYRTWLLLCFTTGPVSSMTRTYIPAVLQTIARRLGYNSQGSECSNFGNDCFISLWSWKVRSNSYVLYLKALYTLIESVISLLIMNIADYSCYRKWMICCCTVLYGALVIPFAGLGGAASKSQLIAYSVLYCLINISNTVLQILEASYIPNFMRIFADEECNKAPEASKLGTTPEEFRRCLILRKGAKVSVMGGFLGNLGGIVALLVGLIISYTHTTGSSRVGVDGYHNFLIAITCAGSFTFAFGILMFWLIPSIKNKSRPEGHYLLFHTIKRSWTLLRQILQYPNAFWFCLGWVTWNLTFSTFMNIFVLLFRSTLGIGNTDAEYTVYTWLSYILASIGSLAWMFLYPRTPLKIKTWAYIFLGFAFFTQLWACLGVSENTKVGFKHRWEFWLFDIFYSSSSSALRSLNRTVYSSILPVGEEAQYFGLEIILGNLVNWGVDFAMAYIQDKTDNDRYPFVLNLFLVAISILFYIKCDTEQGMLDVEKTPVQEQNRNAETVDKENSSSTASVVSIHSLDKVYPV